MNLLSRLSGVFARPRPEDVGVLVRVGDYAAVAAAARYRRIVSLTNGECIDLGVSVREAAVRALGEAEGVGDDELVEALGDPIQSVRFAAVEALGRRRDIDLLCQAIAVWQDTALARVRGAAIDCLFDLAAPGTSRSLVRSLLDRPGRDDLAPPDLALVRTMLEIERRDGVWAEVIDDLLEWLRVEDAVVNRRARTLLVALAPASVERLIAELKVATATIPVASTLGEIKDSRATGPLMGLLEVGDAGARATACEALGELRDPTAVEALLNATRDREHAVRAAAGEALDRLGTVATVLGVAAMLRPTPSSNGSLPARRRISDGGFNKKRSEPDRDLLKRARRLVEQVVGAAHERRAAGNR